MEINAPFPPFDPHGPEGQGKKPNPKTDIQSSATPRLREVPLRLIIPNLITILAIVAGLTGVRLAFEGRFEMAVFMVLAAAFLDGIDGRVARLLKASTRFGAEMDSLADIVNFGVAPAFVLFAYILSEATSIGWVAAVIYAVACSLRLARFNVLNGQDDRPEWQRDYFVGVPAPAGAGLVLLPIYAGFVGVPMGEGMAYLCSIYVVFIAFLLVSRIPVWSAKGATTFRRERVVPLMIGVVAFAMLMASFPWAMLIVCTMGYFAFVVYSAKTYHARGRLEALKAG